MPKNNSEQKEKPLAGISLKMACGSKMALCFNVSMNLKEKKYSLIVEIVILL